MLYRFDIRLTEEDYLKFNIFHSLESTNGKKQLLKNRILIIAFVAILVAFVLLRQGWNPVTAVYVVVIGLLTVLYMLLFKKSIKATLKKQINKLKSIGKLPFDTVSSIEFEAEKFVEITADKRIEQRYEGLEKICIVKDQFLYLYHSSVAAYILPIPQLKEQLDYEDFWNFLSQKCNTIEYY